MLSLFNEFQKWDNWCSFCDSCIQELKLIHNFREKCINAVIGRNNELFIIKEEKHVADEVVIEVTEASYVVDANNIKEELDVFETNETMTNIKPVEISEDTNNDACDENTIELRQSYLCTYCNKQFPTKTKLNRHVDTHIGEKNFICNFCGKAFRKQSILNEHYNVHSGKKSFKCDLCSNSYTRMHSLKIHKKEVHGIGTVKSRGREKKFSCNMCDAKFHANTLLQAHIRTHVGEKPFKCFICEKAFAYGYYLKKHMTIHTDEKPFKCDVCDMRFANNRYLTKHLKKRHQTAQ